MDFPTFEKYGSSFLGDGVRWKSDGPEVLPELIKLKDGIHFIMHTRDSIECIP